MDDRMVPNLVVLTVRVASRNGLQLFVQTGEAQSGVRDAGAKSQEECRKNSVCPRRGVGILSSAMERADYYFSESPPTGISLLFSISLCDSSH